MIVKPTRRRRSGDESYQVDAIVALFAILIVLLLTLVTATASDDSDAETNYRPTDPESPPMVLRSIQVPYGLRDLWSLEADGIMRRIDTVALARRFYTKGDGFEQVLAEDGVDAELTLMRNELGSFRIRVDIFDLDAAQWVVAESFDVRDDEALTAWAAQAEASVIVAPFEARGLLQPVSQALAEGIRRGSIVQLRTGHRYVVLERSAARLSAQGVFRE